MLRKSKMNNKSGTVKAYFDVVCKDATCTLDYTTDYSLLIAIMLSAQCTDKKVNVVTAKLFKDYPTLESLNKLSIKEIEGYLKTLGLYKNKAIYLKGIVKKLLDDYGGKVPQDKLEMQKLPGVGNKTANVMLIEWFKIPAFPVDTHVNRVAKRLGFAKESDSVLDVESKLKKDFESKYWIDLHHKFIYFGRNYCKAINPQCETCKLKEFCSFYKKKK